MRWGTLLEELDGSVGDRLIGYYEPGPKGGQTDWFLAIHGLSTSSERRLHGRPIWDDKFIRGWRELAKRVHQHGGQVFHSVRP